MVPTNTDDQMPKTVISIQKFENPIIPKMGIKTLLVCLLSVIINIVIIIPLGYYDSELLGFNQIFMDFSNIWIFIIPIIVFNSLLAYFSKVIRFFFYPDVLDKIQRDLRSPSLDHKSRLSEYKKNLEGVYKESPESKNTRSSSSTDNIIKG